MSNTRVSSTLCHFNILYFTLCGIITLPTACTRSLCTVCTTCTVCTVCTVCTRSLCTVCTACTACTRSLCTVCTVCTRSLCTVCTACTRSLCTVCTVCTVADVKSQEFLLAKYLISLNKMLKHVLYLFSDKQENAHNVYQ